MTPAGTETRDNFISAILTFIASFCMASAVIGLAAALLPQWNPQICLLFCLLCGILHTMSVCAGQPRLSLILIPGVLLLAVLYFHSWQISAEITAGGALYALCLWLQSHDRLRQAAVAGMVLGLAACHLTGTEISGYLAGACLLCVLTELAGTLVHPRHDHGLRLIPFLILLEAAVLLLPAGDAPFDWSFVIRIGNRISDLAQNVIVEMEYRFSSGSISDRWNAGYGDSNLFGGRFSDDNRVELSVSDQSTRQVLYLSGEEYAGYDGGRWTENPADGNPFVSWYLTFLDSLDRHQITPEKAACFAETESTMITYQYLRTSDVIRPGALLRIDDSVLKDMTGNDGSFAFQRSQGRGRRYHLTFMDLDYANPYLVGILRAEGAGGINNANSGSTDGSRIPETSGSFNSAGASNTSDSHNSENAAPIPTYEHLEETSYRLFGITLSSLISKKDYEARAAAIFHPDLTPWLDTGDTPERVAQLAEQITQDCTNTYDKCKAIERYLRQYPYTKDVDYRGYVNFIDAFLFEKQAGYCIHYASAMVMMLRSIGIPARLVEGYRYDYEVPSENGYDIPGRYAHTWPEAYLDGFGWVRFEPTAAVATADEYGWNLLVAEEVPEIDAATDSDADRFIGAASPSNGSGSTPPPAIAEPSESEEKPSHLTAWLFFGIGIPAVYLLLLLIIQPLFRRYRYRRTDEAGRLGMELADVLWLIRRLCPDTGSNCPLLDYASLLKDPADAADMTRLCLAYYRFRYGSGSAEADTKTNTETGKEPNSTINAEPTAIPSSADSIEPNVKMTLTFDTEHAATLNSTDNAEPNTSKMSLASCPHGNTSKSSLAPCSHENMSPSSTLSANPGSNSELQQTSIRLRQSLYFQYINSSGHGRLLRRLSAYTNLNHPPK